MLSEETPTDPRSLCNAAIGKFGGMAAYLDVATQFKVNLYTLDSLVFISVTSEGLVASYPRPLSTRLSAWHLSLVSRLLLSGLLLSGLLLSGLARNEAKKTPVISAPVFLLFLTADNGFLDCLESLLTNRRAEEHQALLTWTVQVRTLEQHYSSLCVYYSSLCVYYSLLCVHCSLLGFTACAL